MRDNFVPVAARRVLAHPYTLRAGDTPWSIAMAFGQGWSGYGELVGANLHLPLAIDAMPRGHAATLAQLREGQELFLPASWAPAIRAAGGRPTLADGAPDPLLAIIGNQIAELLVHAQKAGKPSPLDPFHFGRVGNAAAAWFRQKYPDLYVGQVTTKQVAPFTAAAIAWVNAYGAQVPKLEADALPWNEIPWGSVHWAAVPWKDIAWPQIAAWAKANMPAGAVTNAVETVPWTSVNWQASAWAQIPWADVPWSAVPWSLIPWGNIDWAEVKAHWPLFRTGTLLDQLKAYAKNPNPAEPAPPPQDEAPLDKYGKPCPLPRMLVNGLCVCGPLTVWNEATQHCDNKGTGPGPELCIPGITVWDPIAKQCVPKPDETKQPNNENPPAAKKEGFPWGSVALAAVAAVAATLAVRSVDRMMKPAPKNKRASR